MVIGTIYDKIVTTLKNNPTLKEYVKQVFMGARFEVGKDTMPCLMVEIVRNNELEKDFNLVKNIWAEFDVLGFIYDYDSESLITGDSRMPHFGILNIENDIKACLQSSYTLGGNVIDTQVDSTEFDYNSLPVRGLRMRVRTLYRQTDSA